MKLKSTSLQSAARKGFLAALVVALFLVPQLNHVITAAPEEQSQVQISATTDAYWYEPAATVGLNVVIDNGSGEAIEDVSVRARIHKANSSRSDLDDCLDGKPTKSYRYTVTIERDLTIDPGRNELKLELPLSKVRLSNGVYPLTLEVRKVGGQVASTVNQLIVMSPPDTEDFPPLMLSVVFDVLEPPHRGPDGKFADNGLGEECQPMGKKTGWFTTLTTEAEKWQNLHLTFSLSPLLLEEMQDMSDGFVLRKGDKEKEYDSESAPASNVTRILNSFRKMATTPRFQFLTTPYTSPDLDRLEALGWHDDAGKQMRLGRKKLEQYLDTAFGKDYFYPPGLFLSTNAIEELAGELGNFVLLGPQLLQRSRQGKRIAQGLTLGNPVEIDGGDDRKVLSLFADARLLSLTDRLSQYNDPHLAAQCILSELTNLYLERPARQRACVLVWPSMWRPSQQVVEEIFKAIVAAPWIQNTTLGEAFYSISPLSKTLLEIPEISDPMNEYFTQVGVARDYYERYSNMVPPDNPNLPLLRSNLYISESDVWRQWDREDKGLEYALSVNETVEKEIAKIDMPVVGSITLTSEKADIPLTVVNGTGYRIKAKLKLSSNGLTFPDGTTRSVTLEPKENVFDIPVKVKKKGRVRFTAILESEGLNLGEIEITVLTSRFNTFAIMVVGGILGLMIAIWAAKVLSRRKIGKHKKGQIRKTREETKA